MGTWLGGERGSAELMVGMDDLRDLFHQNDSVNPWGISKVASLWTET